VTCDHLIPSSTLSSTRATTRRRGRSTFGGRLGGGIVECGTRRAVWLPYVAVDRIEHATARASELGATVLLEPREGPAGWRSVVSTPAGGEIAFWQQKVTA
jgi:predicted enzyme related to lactoylglutathione lyase